MTSGGGATAAATAGGTGRELAVALRLRAAMWGGSAEGLQQYGTRRQELCMRRQTWLGNADVCSNQGCTDCMQNRSAQKSCMCCLQERAWPPTAWPACGSPPKQQAAYLRLRPTVTTSRGDLGSRK